MVIDAVKKHRELFAYGLLLVVALYFVAGLSMLFKSSDQLGGAGFATRAAAYGYLFDHPLLIAGLVLAVVFVALGEPTPNARTVVLVAVGLGGLSLLLAVICWLSGFLADDQFRVLGSVWGGGKAVAALIGIAGLLFLALATAFAALVLQRLPRPLPAPPAWSGPPPWGPGYGQQQDYGAPGPYGQQGGYGSPSGYGEPTGPEQQGYAPGQQPPPWGEPPPQWGQQGWQPVQPGTEQWPQGWPDQDSQPPAEESPPFTASWGSPEPPPTAEQPSSQPTEPAEDPAGPERRDPQQ